MTQDTVQSWRVMDGVFSPAEIVRRQSAVRNNKNPTLMDKIETEVYKTIFETWRYEVDSYWQRNNYFAAFETVALAGGWYVVEHNHLWSGLVFSLLGAVSTVVWLITSIAVHRYIRYWWRSIKDIEAKLSLQDCKLAFATEHPGSGLHPSQLVHLIPVLFMIAWTVIFSLAVHCLCRCSAC
jgi:hypothetical protein